MPGGDILDRHLERRKRWSGLVDMVRLATPVAINRDDSALDSQAGESAETLERRIQAEYDKALDQERSGNKAEAQVLESTTTHCRYSL